jgi:hypothetical protein
VERWQDPPLGTETAAKGVAERVADLLGCVLHRQLGYDNDLVGRLARLRPSSREDGGEPFPGVKEPVCVGRLELEPLP